MAPTTPAYLYMLAEDLFRIGNATSSKLANLRVPKDVATYDRNGVTMVRSNGGGISLVTEARLTRERSRYAGSYLWKLPALFPMPPGLALSADMRDVPFGQLPDHYLLCPHTDMPIGEYVGLLQKLALRLERVQKL